MACRWLPNPSTSTSAPPPATPHCLLPDPPYPPYTTAAPLLAALAAWLNPAAPPAPHPLLLHYAGHGAIQAWAGQPVLLQTGDLPNLGHAPHLPVVLDMSCYTGYFHFPGLPSLAAAWLATPNHGAVAVVASSGLDLVAAHAPFDAALLAALGDPATTTIGQAFLAAKLAAAAGGLPQAVATFHLFGDPAMPLWAAVPTPPPTAPTPPGSPPNPPPATPSNPPNPPTAAPGPLPGPPAHYLFLPWLPAEGER